MTTVAIVQSNYLPWKGYFDLIAAADVFVLLDDVQFTRRDWRNRNRIKTPRGLQWITVPVQASGNYYAPIRAIRTDGNDWAEKHINAISTNYAGQPHLAALLGWLAPLLRAGEPSLSRLNARLLERICAELAINTPLRGSDEFDLVDEPTDRLVSICRQLGATRYLSGPAARVYLDVDRFTAAGIAVDWFCYSPYPEYPQPWGDFVHEVSVIDLMAACGPDSRRYLRCGAS